MAESDGHPARSARQQPAHLVREAVRQHLLDARVDARVKLGAFALQAVSLY
jgi:hypothetical protein